MYSSGPASGLFDARDLISVKLVSPPDRDIFSEAETFLAQAETGLGVPVTLLVIKIPLAAGLAPQPTDPDRLALLKIPDATEFLGFLPFVRIEEAFPVERQQNGNRRS